MFDPERYAAGIRKANERESRVIENSIVAARREAERLAAEIGRETGADRVLLFGSLAESTVRSADFDIDLCIDGGDVERAIRIAEESPFRVDVVSYRSLPAHVKRRVDESAVPLFRRT